MWGSVALSLDGGQNLVPAPWLDFVYASPRISSVQPHAGPRDGGTDITVTGTGFSEMGGARCAFGATDESRVFAPASVDTFKQMCATVALSTAGSFLSAHAQPREERKAVILPHPRTLNTL